jgi:hypothetical protein
LHFDFAGFAGRTGARNWISKETKTMRKLVVLFSALMLAVTAGTAGAKTLDWHGTLDIDLGALETLTLLGSGVATVNGTTGETHLNTLRLAGGITGNDTIQVTDPETTPQIPSIRIGATLGTATLSGISGGGSLSQGKLPVGGFTRVCLFTVGCATALPLQNTKNNGATGLGVGGLLTLGGAAGNVRISIVNQPWTLGTVSGVNQTVSGGFKTLSRVGFVHGNASSTSSTATGSGVVQLIAPQQVTTAGITGNSEELTLFAALTIHFIPEPGLLLLIGSGVVGLGLLGRSRMKK